MAMAQLSFASFSLHVTKNLWPWHSSMISQQVTSPIFVTRQTPRYFTYSLKVIFQHNVERSIAFFPPLRIHLFSTRQDSLLLLQNRQQMKGKKGLESGERSNQPQQRRQALRLACSYCKLLPYREAEEYQQGNLRNSHHRNCSASSNACPVHIHKAPTAPWDLLSAQQLGANEGRCITFCLPESCVGKKTQEWIPEPRNKGSQAFCRDGVIIPGPTVWSLQDSVLAYRPK